MQKMCSKSVEIDRGRQGTSCPAESGRLSNGTHIEELKKCPYGSYSLIARLLRHTYVPAEGIEH